MSTAFGHFFGKKSIISRFFSSKYQPFLHLLDLNHKTACKHFTQKERRSTKKHPRKKEIRTNLPVKIERHFRIVPHIHSECNIQHTTEDKLKACNKNPAADTPYIQRKRRISLLSGIEPQKADASENKHCGVGMPSPQYFTQSVAKSAEGKHRRILCRVPCHTAPTSFRPAVRSSLITSHT